LAGLYPRALESERKRLWAECRLKGLGKGTPERLRIEELDRLLAEHRAKPAGKAGTSVRLSGIRGRGAMAGYGSKPTVRPNQGCFLAVVAVKSGSFFATQSTNLRRLGLASRASTSVPWRCSSELVKLAISVC